MRRLFALVLLAVSAVASSGCYVMKDERGQWWACEDYQTPHGVATGCTPIDPPF